MVYKKGKVHRRLNAFWKICSLAVNGQSFLVIDGYLLNSFISVYWFMNLEIIYTINLFQTSIIQYTLHLLLSFSLLFHFSYLFLYQSSVASNAWSYISFISFLIP